MAGQVFLSLLAGWYGDNFRTHYFDEQNNPMPSRYTLKPGLCIHGHFNKSRRFGTMDYYPKVDQFITILRYPFEMAVSNYFYVKKLGQNSFRDGQPYKFKDRFSSVNDFLAQNRSYLLEFLPDHITLENYKELFARHFVYIGIVEDLQTSVNILACKLGFPSAQIGHENTAIRDEKVSAEVHRDYIQRHPLEYAIYNYAQENYRQ